MKLIITTVAAVFFTWYSYSQRVYRIEIEPFQEADSPLGANGPNITVPNQTGVAIMGGTYDTEGLGRYLLFNGSRLTIDSMVMGFDGYSYVQLRREDGRRFFNKFLIISAKLIPIERAN